MTNGGDSDGGGGDGSGDDGDGSNLWKRDWWNGIQYEKYPSFCKQLSHTVIYGNPLIALP